jgi:hypothetical protein
MFQTHSARESSTERWPHARPFGRASSALAACRACQAPELTIDQLDVVAECGQNAVGLVSAPGKARLAALASGHDTRPVHRLRQIEGRLAECVELVVTCDPSPSPGLAACEGPQPPSGRSPSSRLRAHSDRIRWPIARRPMRPRGGQLGDFIENNPAWACSADRYGHGVRRRSTTPEGEGV